MFPHNKCTPVNEAWTSVQSGGSAGQCCNSIRCPPLSPRGDHMSWLGAGTLNLANHPSALLPRANRGKKTALLRDAVSCHFGRPSCDPPPPGRLQSAAQTHSSWDCSNCLHRHHECLDSKGEYALSDLGITAWLSCGMIECNLRRLCTIQINACLINYCWIITKSLLITIL